VFGAYLVWNQATQAWLDVIRFNLHYARFDGEGAPNPGLVGLLAAGIGRGGQVLFSVSRITTIAAVAGAMSMFVPGFRRQTAGFPVATSAFFLANLFGVSLARRYAYYYLQLVSSYVLLAACGLALLCYLTRRRRWLAPVVTGVTALALLAVDPKPSADFLRSLAHPRERWDVGADRAAVVRALTRPDEPIWNLIRGGDWIYAMADRLAPTRFLYLPAHLFRDLPDAEAARREIVSALETHPPRVVLCDEDRSAMTEAGLQDWFEHNYVPGPLPDVYVTRAK